MIIFLRIAVAYVTQLFALADKPSDAKDEHEAAPANE